MKRIICCTIFTFLLLASMSCLSGCNSTSSSNDFNEVSMIEYYKKEDFKFITIGESTYKDVYEVASTESMQITSYGGFCEYPMQNGGCICIKFYGKDLIVGAIEEVPSPIE